MDSRTLDNTYFPTFFFNSREFTQCHGIELGITSERLSLRHQISVGWQCSKICSMDTCHSLDPTRAVKQGHNFQG